MQEREKLWMLLGQLYAENFDLNRLAAMLKAELKNSHQDTGNGLSEPREPDKQDYI